MSIRVGEQAPVESSPMVLARTKVQPRLLFGRFKRVRLVISAVLQSVLFFGPWIMVDGQQAVRIDLAARKLHLFTLTFWPQDTAFLLVMLIFLAVLMFASTAVAGRMWCGYACPQTLLTESFVFVETFFEGSRAKRIKLATAPWTADKAARKLGKWSVWTVMSLWLGVTFAGYFQDAYALVSNLLHGHVSAWNATIISIVASAAYFDFGWFREQMCHYACPYARFQSAMFDADSLIVGYDVRRGEPRGRLGSAGTGDCIDCSMCTQVCPMGIDIRNGLQLECIACTACVDACDSVMDRIGRPRGLVGYSSLNTLAGRPLRIVRPRVAVYAAMLVALGGVFIAMLAHRPLLVVDVMRKSGAQAVYAVTADGHVSNLYHLNFINKDRVAHEVQISVEGFPGACVVAPENPLVLAADSARDVDVFVVHPPAQLPPVTHFSFRFADARSQRFGDIQEATFLGPSR